MSCLRKKHFKCYFHSPDKRVFRPYMRHAPRRTHEQTLIWAEQVQNGEYEEIMGITGKSIFFDVENFDVVKGILPEPMHLMDGGFMKNTAGRTFRSGTAQQTRAGYRRSSSATLSTLIE